MYFWSKFFPDDFIQASENESNQLRQETEFQRIEHSLALEEQMRRVRSIQSRFGLLEEQVFTLNIMCFSEMTS